MPQRTTGRSIRDELNVIFLRNERDIHAKAQTQASYLFKWTLGRLLLGLDYTDSLVWLGDQLDKFTISDSPKKDVARWVHLLACSLIHGLSVSEQAERGLALLAAQGARQTDYSLVQAGLALSSLCKAREDTEEWISLGFALPERPEAESFAFELLTIVTAVCWQVGLSPESLANIMSRVFVDSLWAAPAYSAAPHVCALSAGTAIPLADLLANRVSAMDDGLLESTGRLRVVMSSLATEISGGPHSRSIILSIGAHGTGEFDPSLYPMPELSLRLLTTLRGVYRTMRATPDASRRTADVHAAQGKEFSEWQSGTALRFVLRCDPTLELSDEGRACIHHRFDVGWRYAAAQAPELTCEASLECNCPTSARGSSS